MIIELVGLPGTGKTTLATALSAEGAETVSIDGRSKLLWESFLFFLTYPIASLSLTDWILRTAPRGMKYSMFVNGCMVYGARFHHAHREAKKGEVAVLDQGHAQLLISLGTMPLKLLHELPKPDLLVIVTAPDAVRKQRMQDRGRQPREEFGAQVAEAWDQHAQMSLKEFRTKYVSSYPAVTEQDGEADPKSAAQQLLQKSKSATVSPAAHSLKSIFHSIGKSFMLGIAAVVTRSMRTFKWKGEPEVAVLMYHSIGYSGWKHAITPQAFKKQMAYLRRKRNPVPLKHVVRYAKGGSAIPERAVAVTIDDGYVDLLTMALPILKKYQIPATLFLTTDPTAPTSSSINLPRLSKEELQALMESGLVTIESHGRTHRHFPTLSPEELSDELRGSAEDIQKLLKIHPLYFAYPYGDRSQEVEAAVANAGYEAAFAITEGLIHPQAKEDHGLMHLKRIQIDATMGFWMFRTRLTRAVEMNRLIVNRLRGIFKRS